MQIHELTRRQLHEVDIVGPDGVLSKIGTAAKALAQPGGVKSALKTITPGFGQGAFSTKDLVTGNFAQRMQAVRNNAAIKQVAANLQQQWMQASKTLPPATATPATATPATATPTLSTQAANLQTSQARLAASAAKRKALYKENVQLNEAASLGQLTDWYEKSVIPKSMQALAAEYSKNPIIKTALEKIVATDNNSVEQSKAFVDLVAATSAKSQEISAKNPQLATTANASSSKATKTLSGGSSAAKTNLSKAAGIAPSQIDAIAKVVGELPPVTSRDPNTIAYLQALGFDVQ
jgi:hypothetical protein